MNAANVYRCILKFINVLAQSYVIAMKTEVISVRVNKDVKKALSRRRANLSKLVGRYLENLAKAEMSREAMLRLREIVEKRVTPSKKGFAADSVREDRYATH